MVLAIINAALLGVAVMVGAVPTAGTDGDISAIGECRDSVDHVDDERESFMQGVKWLDEFVDALFLDLGAHLLKIDSKCLKRFGHCPCGI